MLSYNQEHFVGEAIAAAFAQDYSNLQIILSDDGSSDGTFEIIADAAQRYVGPHSIEVNRTKENRGVLAHVFEATDRATGDLILLAAGDDVSLPHRVSRTVAAWRETGADAFHSPYILIDAEGQLISDYYGFEDSRPAMRDYFPGSVISSVHGASSAYRRDVFSRWPRPDVPILFEDTYFSLLVAQSGGKVTLIGEPLVKYRQHGASITNAPTEGAGWKQVAERERRAQRFAASIESVLKVFREQISGSGTSKRVLTLLNADIAFYELRSKWIEMGSLERLRATFSMRRYSHFRWILPRLFGLELFARIRGSDR